MAYFLFHARVAISKQKSVTKISPQGLEAHERPINQSMENHSDLTRHIPWLPKHLVKR